MIAKKPPLGWNTWNTFGENINEALILETADKMIEYGYKDAGYEYVVIDDCWALKKRGMDGRLVPDPEKFPHGMKYIADYLHERGLKFGMYSCAGTLTCAGYPSSYGHEYVDAKTFAEWEIDYLKYDYCYFPKSGDCKTSYLTMSMALRSCGRDILFAACNWGMEKPWEWMRSIGAHMYRSTGDIFDNYTSFKDIMLSQENNFSMSTPDCYNDIDMLTIGMYGNGNAATKGGCTDEEYKFQFALWCMFSAPLMMGGDIRNMNDFCKNLMQNKELIAINQDEEGRPPYIVQHWDTYRKIYFKIMSNNQFAIMFVNYEDEKRHIQISLPDLGLPPRCGKALKVHDCFTGENIGILDDVFGVDVNAHSCVLYKGTIIDA